MEEQTNDTSTMEPEAPNLLDVSSSVASSVTEGRNSPPSDFANAEPVLEESSDPFGSQTAQIENAEQVLQVAARNLIEMSKDTSHYVENLPFLPSAGPYTKEDLKDVETLSKIMTVLKQELGLPEAEAMEYIKYRKDSKAGTKQRRDELEERVRVHQVGRAQRRIQLQDIVREHEESKHLARKLVQMSGDDSRDVNTTAPLPSPKESFETGYDMQKRLDSIIAALQRESGFSYDEVREFIDHNSDPSVGTKQRRNELAQRVQEFQALRAQKREQLQEIVRKHEESKRSADRVKPETASSDRKSNVVNFESLNEHDKAELRAQTGQTNEQMSALLKVIEKVEEKEVLLIAEREELARRHEALKQVHEHHAAKAQDTPIDRSSGREISTSELPAERDKAWWTEKVEGVKAVLDAGVKQRSAKHQQHKDMTAAERKHTESMITGKTSKTARQETLGDPGRPTGKAHLQAETRVEPLPILDYPERFFLKEGDLQAYAAIHNRCGEQARQAVAIQHNMTDGDRSRVQLSQSLELGTLYLEYGPIHNILTTELERSGLYGILDDGTKTTKGRMPSDSDTDVYSKSYLLAWIQTMLSLGKRGEMITEFLRSRFCAEQPLVVALSKHSPDIVGLAKRHMTVRLLRFPKDQCISCQKHQSTMEEPLRKCQGCSVVMHCSLCTEPHRSMHQTECKIWVQSGHLLGKASNVLDYVATGLVVPVDGDDLTGGRSSRGDIPKKDRDLAKAAPAVTEHAIRKDFWSESQEESYDLLIDTYRIHAADESKYLQKKRGIYAGGPDNKPIDDFRDFLTLAIARAGHLIPSNWLRSVRGKCERYAEGAGENNLMEKVDEGHPYYDHEATLAWFRKMAGVVYDEDPLVSDTATEEKSTTLGSAETKIENVVLSCNDLPSEWVGKGWIVEDEFEMRMMAAPSFWPQTLAL